MIYVYVYTQVVYIYICICNIHNLCVYVHVVYTPLDGYSVRPSSGGGYARSSNEHKHKRTATSNFKISNFGYLIFKYKLFKFNI